MKKEILYYTSSREEPEFEKKIVNWLLKTTDLPIISVSQKPMDLGKNICVGDVGLSYLNLYRQQLIGAKESDADWLIFAESDFLYPPEYFEFEPGDSDVYLYDNVWIMYSRKVSNFKKKKNSHGAQYVRRDFLVDRLEEGLEGMPEWFDGHPVPWKSRHQRGLVSLPKYEQLEGKIPAISFKTGDGVRDWTNAKLGSKSKLPYWGEASVLREEFL